MRAGLPVGENYQQRSTLGRLARLPRGRRDSEEAGIKPICLTVFKQDFILNDVLECKYLSRREDNLVTFFGG